MAVIAPKRTIDTKGDVVITWGSMATTDTGGPAYIGDLDDVVIQVTSGGAGTAQLRGSNDNVTFANIGAAMGVGFTALTTIPFYVDLNPIAAATVTSVQLKGHKH